LSVDLAYLSIIKPHHGACCRQPGVFAACTAFTDILLASHPQRIVEVLRAAMTAVNSCTLLLEKVSGTFAFRWLIEEGWPADRIVCNSQKFSAQQAMN